MNLSLKQKWILHNTSNIIEQYLNTKRKAESSYGINSLFAVETKRDGHHYKKSFTCNKFEFGYFSEIINYGYYIAHSDILIYEDKYIHKLPINMLIEIATNLETISSFTKKLKKEIKSSHTLKQQQIEKERKILESIFQQGE